jgi:hypothetical protein
MKRGGCEKLFSFENGITFNKVMVGGCENSYVSNYPQFSFWLDGCVLRHFSAIHISNSPRNSSRSIPWVIP